MSKLFTQSSHLPCILEFYSGDNIFLQIFVTTELPSSSESLCSTPPFSYFFQQGLFKHFLNKLVVQPWIFRFTMKVQDPKRVDHKLCGFEVGYTSLKPNFSPLNSVNQPTLSPCTPSYLAALITQFHLITDHSPLTKVILHA